MQFVVDLAELVVHLVVGCLLSRQVVQVMKGQSELGGIRRPSGLWASHATSWAHGLNMPPLCIKDHWDSNKESINFILKQLLGKLFNSC